jgi:hypothetical protein
MKFTTCNAPSRANTRILPRQSLLRRQQAKVQHPRLLQLRYHGAMTKPFLSFAAVLLLTCASAMAQPQTAPPDPTQPETAKDDHKLAPENAKDDDKLKPETATDTRKPTKRDKAAANAKRGVRSNTPPPKRKPPADGAR